MIPYTNFIRTNHPFKKLSLPFFLLIFFSACDTTKRAFYHEEERNWESSILPNQQELIHTVFIAGCAGEKPLHQKSIVLPVLEQELKSAGKESTMVFLGDNVPVFNRNNKHATDRAKKILDAQLDMLQNYPGKVYFLPGEKDWNKGSMDGREALLWQAEYIEERLGDKNVFLPNKACGDPDKEEITDDIRLLFVDSQWWLQDWDDIHNINEKCEFKDRLGFLLELEDDLKKYDKERVVLFMHHPPYSNGSHGGGFTWKQHLFPFTIWNKNAWVPLPGIGTLIAVAKQLGVSRQDASHTRYATLKKEIMEIANKKPHNRNLIIASAHDHSLQYFEDPNEHIKFLVSGSAGEADFARAGRNARFAHAREGFAKLYFYKNLETWMEFVVCREDGTTKVVFRKKIFEGVIQSDTPPTVTEFPPMSDSVTVTASEFYEARALRKLTLGDRYRKAWSTPVKVPVFNLEEEFKDLTPVKQGGGQSTNSLRFQHSNGKQYTLRSIEKDISRGLPKDFRRTLVQDFIQDFKSGSHPYAAFVIPGLAEAANIYHANPKLYYLPAQTRLGPYNENFADALYLFEERPDDDDWSDSALFDYSPDIISYVDLLDKLQKNPKHQIDEKWTLRTRLFDQWIHDYDRHDDQWRWASFPKNDDLTVYRPIPRDRDQAFFDLRGFVPFVISRPFLRIQQRGFTGKIRDVSGEAYPGHVFDRAFITELNREEWIAVAEELKAGLTDDVIENAFNRWPEEIRNMNAPHIIKILKERRDRIPIHAAKLYDFYATYVDIPGTNKDDLFQIEYRPGGSMSLQIFEMKKGEPEPNPYYQRIFLKGETREIHLYGLEGDDRFEVSGSKHKSIRVRIIGGYGEDEIDDNTGTALFRKKTVAYDTPDGITLRGAVKDMRSAELKVNEYDRNEFKYNRYFPQIIFGRTIDDGFMIGGGVQLNRYRFRKRPYGIQHNIFARFSANTSAFNVRYSGDYVGAIGRILDFNPDIRVDRPVIFNFFGFGNNTVVDPNLPNSFNWVRLEQFSIRPLLKRTWYNGRNFTRFGPFFEQVEVDNRTGRITDTPLFTSGDLEKKDFLGFLLEHSFQAVDNPAIPQNGIKFQLELTHYQNLADEQSYTRLFGHFTSYLTVGSKISLTLATRIGAATLSNDDFLFYHSNNLGGNNFLRGFRNNRFGGKSLFFHNTDLRLKLFASRNYFMPLEFGIMTGFDYGRVWSDNDTSDTMHTGISPGFWITPYRTTAVSAFYTFTNGDEVDTYTIRVGYFF